MCIQILKCGAFIADLKIQSSFYFTYLKIQKWICDILERRWRIQKLFLDNF